MRGRTSRIGFQPFEYLGQSRSIGVQVRPQIGEHVLLDSLAMGGHVLINAQQCLGETGSVSVEFDVANRRRKSPGFNRTRRLTSPVRLEKPRVP